jgi:hypothetical protein
MDVWTKNNGLKKTKCVVEFFSKFFEIFWNFLKSWISFFEFFEKLFFEKWTTSSGNPEQIIAIWVPKLANDVDDDVEHPVAFFG